MHAELFCRFTLIAAVTRKNLENVLFLELAHRVGVTDSSGVHLEDEVVEFAFQSRVFLLWSGHGPWLGSDYMMTRLTLKTALDPIRWHVLEMVELVKQTPFEIGGHDEGYSMSGPKKIRGEMRIFNPRGTG